MKSKDTGSADAYNKRNVLRHRIENWRVTQDIYMPGLAELRAMDMTSIPSESMPLYLPSSLPCGLRQTVASLAEKEQRLRLAQADDALTELRRLLRISMGLWNYKFRQIGPSQRASTRTRALIDHFKDKIHRCAERYRAARAALLSLDPAGSWILRLHDLKNEDIRAPQKEEDKHEGDQAPSWIWLGPSTAGVVESVGDDEVHESRSSELQESLLTNM